MIRMDELKRCLNELLENRWLTDYDRRMLESYSYQLERKSKLSDKQIEVLQSISDKYKDTTIMEEWEAGFTGKKLVNLLVLAYYYSRVVEDAYTGDGTRKFKALSKRILHDKYLPSKREYQSLSTNKYALKVLQSHNKEPKFSVGQKIYPKKGAQSPTFKKLQNGGFVLRADAEPVISHAKGAKRYLVLPVGLSYGVVIEERHMTTRKSRSQNNGL